MCIWPDLQFVRGNRPHTRHGAHWGWRAPTTIDPPPTKRTHSPTRHRCFRLNKPCKPLTTKPRKRGRKPKAALPDEGEEEEAASLATASYAGDDFSQPGSAFGLSPLPDGAADSTASPLLDLVIDRADPRCFSELYLQVGELLGGPPARGLRGCGSPTVCGGPPLISKLGGPWPPPGHTECSH